jgi:branched-chain amino acid aminotransferase
MNWHPGLCHCVVASAQAKMANIVMIDGRLVEPAEARIDVWDRGFLYGDSVFETLRTYGQKPFRLQAHLARLERSAALVRLQLPVPSEQLARELNEAVAAQPEGESLVRLMVTRGVGRELGLDPVLALHPTRVVFVVSLRPPPLLHYEQGVVVVTYRTERPSDHTAASGAKIGNYLVAVLAAERARAAGAVEALVLDRADNVVEGTTSNVFAVVSGALVTPPVSAGILAGITRELILELARDLRFEIREQVLSLEELYGAEEVFISSSVREMLPVVRVDDTLIGTGAPGPVTRALLQAYRAFTAGSVA